MSANRVAVYSTGIPDPSQGGSGIFNYYVVKLLLDRGYQVDGYFRVGKEFLDKHTVNTYHDELVAAGLNSFFIDRVTLNKRILFGYDLLHNSHKVDLCAETVNQVLASKKQYLAHIAHDLGWILALAGKTSPVVGLIGDPLPNRLRHGYDVRLFSPRSWLLRLQALSAGSRYTYAKLSQRLNDKVILGSFTPSHAQEAQSKGLNCTHFRWFSPEVAEPVRTRARIRDNVFRVLHVGTLASTASIRMLSYWTKDLLPELSRLPFSVEITFVGRAGPMIQSHSDNIRLKQLGHQESIEAAFEKCDVFFSPMQYPVGTRTRILTAMSHAVPTIADPSASEGLPELTSGSEIFYGRNPAEIRSLIEMLHERPDLIEEIGNKARKKWELLFHPMHNVSSILEAIGL